MKANLYICGVPRGVVEIGENSIIAKLARRDLKELGIKLADMEDEINRIGGPVTCKVNLSVGDKKQ